MSNPTIIENPEKIGFGISPIFGAGALLEGTKLLEAGWFYSWTPSLPGGEFAGWKSGSGLSIAGTPTDHALKLGSVEGWAMQKVAISGTGTVTLSFEGAAGAGSSGGVSVQFLSAAGNVLGTRYVTIGEGTSNYTLTAATPSGAASVNVIAWADRGDGVTIDDLSLK